MALAIKDRVKETTTTTGTGTYTLAGAVTGFETFGSVGDGNTTYYVCTDNTNFEVGIGTYTSSGTTLARTTILQSSNSDSAVNWSSGTRTIFCTYPADKAVFKDASNNINGTFVGNITGNVTGNASGTAATVTTAAQTNITSLGTLTALTVDNVIIDGTTIGHTSDTDLITLADGVVTVAGEISVTTLDIGGDNVTSSATELNLLDGVSGLVQADFTKLAAVDSTAAELNIVDAGTSATSTTVVDADRVVFNDADAGMVQVAVTDLAAYFDDEITAMPNLTSVGTLTTLTVDNVIINGTTIGHTDDTDLMTLADGVLTVAGELDATTLDISGNADIDGTLEADAYTVDGTALNEYIADTVGAMVTSNTESGITVAYQDADNTLDFTVGTLNQDTTGTASLAVVTDSTANTNFPVVFHNESNGLLDDTGALRYNPSTGELLVPKLTVAGTTTTADTVTMQAANAVVFEGATADAHETTLSIVDPTGDHTQYLINQGGYIPVLAAVTTTAITSTPAEINLIDGGTARGTTSVASGDGLLVNDGGTMRMTNVDTVSTYFSSHNVGGGNIVTTGALNSGSITSGFGSINNGSSAIATTGTVTYGSLSDGTITITAFVDEDDMTSDSATLVPTQQSVKAYVDANAGGGGMSNFILEDGDGTEVTVADGKEVKFVEGGGIDINWTDTSTGSDADPYDLTFTINAAQTDITSIYATDLIIGEDAQTAIDFGTVNEIDFKVDNAARLTLTASALYPVTDNQIDLGTSSLEFKNAYFDGTVTTDYLNVAYISSTPKINGSYLWMGTDAAVLYFGVNFEVTLTHVHNVGLRLNTDKTLSFRDSAINIGSPADGYLDINADTEIELNATTIDINGAVEVSGNLDVGGSLETATIDYTDGDNAITIADGGGTTFPQTATFTSGIQSNGTLTVGVDDTGHDVKFFGATSGRYMLWDESDDSLILPDSTSLKFGDSGDLTISHNASHSLITDSGQGQLKIQASQLHVQSADGNTTGARFRTGAEVELYHNGSQKFETTSGGIDVTGSVTATSLDISGDADIDGTLEADAITVNGSTLTSVIADEATALAIALG